MSAVMAISSASTSQSRESGLQILLPNTPGFRPSTNARNGYEINDVYALGETSSDRLGEGAFGVVCLGRHKHAETGDEGWARVAIKTCKPNALDINSAPGRVIQNLDQLERYCQEIRALSKLRKANPTLTPVLHLYEYFMDGPDLYLVSELLESPLDEWKDSVEVFTEKDAIDISRTLLGGLKYIHDRAVIHRDIKPQNILFRQNGNFKSLKICDFGLAKVLGEHETTMDFCGSPGYIAPEIYQKKPYRYEVDMFAFGSLLFKLLSGERAFPGNQKETRRRTLELRYNVRGSEWAQISQPAMDLVRRLLINREERLKATEALSHDWFNELGQSVLPQTLIRANDNASDAIIQVPGSNPSTIQSVHIEGSPRYWVESSMQEGLQMLIFAGLFNATLTEQPPDENGEAGWILCTEGVSDHAVTLPEYIGSLEHFTEKECRDLFVKLVDCMEILHETTRIAHRNLHLENFLVNLVTGQVTMKGFHYAQPIISGRPLTGHFGFLYSWFAFSAPEIDKSFVHDMTVDWWSMGAILYMMLTGIAPFTGTGMDLFFNKHAGIVSFDISSPSMAAERLVKALLNIHSDMRYRLLDVQTDQWIHADDDYLQHFDLSLAMYQFQCWDEKGDPGDSYTSGQFSSHSAF